MPRSLVPYLLRCSSMLQPKLSPKDRGRHSSWLRARNSAVIRPSAAFNWPPQLRLMAWRALQAPSIIDTCQPPPPPATPLAHPVGTALQQTGSICRSLTGAVMLPRQHISALRGMRGEHRCKGRPGIALLLPLARCAAGRTLTHGSSSCPKCSDRYFRCRSSPLWHSYQRGHRFLLPPRAYCPGELLSASCP